MYKHTFINQRAEGDGNASTNQISMTDLPAGYDLPDFKVGIIGCG